MTTSTLAKAILKAATIREESYDHNRAVNADSIIDFRACYTLSLRQACEQACTELNISELVEPVYLLLANSWNDSLDWAEEHS